VGTYIIGADPGNGHSGERWATRQGLWLESRFGPRLPDSPYRRTGRQVAIAPHKAAQSGMRLFLSAYSAYSSLNEEAGSVCTARQAGMAPARSTTKEISPSAKAIARGSEGLIS